MGNFEEEIASLEWEKFEDLILQLVGEMGFEAKKTKTTGDGGIDIWAENNQRFTEGVYLIQCKHQNAPVGEPKLRDLYGVVHHENANKGIFITSSHFTNPAKKFAENKQLELIDATQLENLVREYLNISELINKKGSESKTLDSIRNKPVEICNRVFSDNWDPIRVKFEKLQGADKTRSIYSVLEYSDYITDLTSKTEKMNEEEILKLVEKLEDYNKSLTISEVKEFRRLCKKTLDTLKIIVDAYEGTKRVNPPFGFKSIHERWLTFLEEVFFWLQGIREDISYYQDSAKEPKKESNVISQRTELHYQKAIEVRLSEISFFGLLIRAIVGLIPNTIASGYRWLLRWINSISRIFTQKL